MTFFRKFSALSLLSLPALLVMTACGGPPQQSETAEDYAARINAPTAIAGEQGQAAPGPMENGTQTDPAASACGATSVTEYLGQGDTPEIRQAINDRAQARGGIRFIWPGEAQTQDFNNNRLNVMFDANGVIRDFRCG